MSAKDAGAPSHRVAASVRSAASQRRLTVHVGTAKAGSTSIQSLLAARWRQLARSGIHVPLAGAGPGPPGAHHGLARELRRPQRAAGHWARLAAEIRRSPASRFVISCEAFTGPGHRLRAAARLLALAADEDLDIDIVGYVRPQWQWLEAGYAQEVSTGRTAMSFAAFVERMLAEAAPTRLDYSAVFAPFRAAFGDRVRVLPLERARLAGGLLAHFLVEILGVQARAPGASSVAWANARPGAKELEVRRLVCESVGTPLPAAGKLVWLPALLDGDSPFAGFAPDEIDNIAARFADANARFARAYGVDAQGVLFRDDDASHGRRPSNVARWEDIGAPARRRVRRYVFDATGVDLDLAAGARAGRSVVAAHLAWRGPRTAAPRADAWLRTAGFRIRRARQRE